MFFLFTFSERMRKRKNMIICLRWKHKNLSRRESRHIRTFPLTFCQVCVCVCVCMYVYKHACVHACVSVCVRGHVCVKDMLSAVYKK